MTPELQFLPTKTWMIEGVERIAALYTPPVLDKPVKSPVFICFHGHGGSGIGYCRVKPFHEDWKGAICIYPNGLDTKSGGDPDGSEPGWQHHVGEINSVTGIRDQDLKLFDAIIADYPDRNVYVHGFSNGGEFCYDCLWVARADKLKAMAVASAINNTLDGKIQLPVMHIAGTNDPAVGYIAQKTRTIAIAKFNQCNEGIAWETGDEVNGVIAIKYSSKIAKPVIFVQHNDGHNFPLSVDPLIVKFLRNLDRRTDL